MLSTTRFVLLALAAGFSEANDFVDVTTAYGVVQGVSTPQGRYFRGIPYAAPPVGDLRWRRPRDPPSWNGTYNATEFGADCYQWAEPDANGTWHGAWWTIGGLDNMSEDCLFVNVVTPPMPPNSSASDQQWPVVVYFHAGEFYMGAGDDGENNWPYDSAPGVPSSLIDHNVVLVTLNYRLGYLGFVAADELRHRDENGSTGNYGIQDQRQALKWVQQNIEAFGGDPNNVILAGESSGGTGVGMHLIMKESWGLYHKVIMQSPGFTQIKPLDRAYLDAKYLMGLLAVEGNFTFPCQFNAFGPGLEQEGAWVEYPFPLVSGVYNVTNFTSVEEAVAVCASDMQCMGVTTTNISSTKVNAMFSTDFNVNRHPGGVWDAPPVATYLRGPNMTLFESCLMQQNATTLLNNMRGPFRDTIFENQFGPVPDGVEFNDTLVNSLLRGELPQNISYLVGSNLDEGTEFISEAAPVSCAMNDTDLETWAALTFPANVPSIAAGILETYANLTQPVPRCYGANTTPAEEINYVRATRAVGDSTFLCLVRALGNRLLVDSPNSVPGSSMYNYYWAHQPLVTLNMPPELEYFGAFHGSEVPFVFGYPAELNDTAEVSLSHSMGCYWANFAATGDPNTGNCNTTELAPVTWDPYREPGSFMDNATRTLILDVDGQTRMITNLRKDICTLYTPLWNSSTVTL